MSWQDTFKLAASYAPLATALIALGAAIIALVAMFIKGTLLVDAPQSISF